MDRERTTVTPVLIFCLYRNAISYRPSLGTSTSQEIHCPTCFQLEPPMVFSRVLLGLYGTVKGEVRSAIGYKVESDL